MNYRERIYEKYGANFQDAKPVFDAASAARWCKAYKYYFRGWLPTQKDASMADLACGGGKLLYFLRERGYSRLCGVDISPDQVSLAKQVVPDVHLANVLDFLRAHPDSFDLLTGLDIIEHFHKDEAMEFLDLCYKAIRKGGRLVLQTPNAESPWGTLHRYNDFTHEICFNSNLLLRLLSLRGFQFLESRELGPVPFGYSVFSTARYGVWQAIRAGLKLWNMAETGGAGSGVFTRVFLASGVK